MNPILKLVLGITLLAFAGISYLLYESNLPSPLVPEAEVAKDGGKLFKLKSGRLLEYFDSGEPAGVQDAPILVMVHGGFQTGKRSFSLSTYDDSS